MALVKPVPGKVVRWAFRVASDSVWLGHVWAQTWFGARAMARVELYRLGHVEEEAICERADA